jgi:hypothetical protein
MKFPARSRGDARELGAVTARVDDDADKSAAMKPASVNLEPERGIFAHPEENGRS